MSAARTAAALDVEERLYTVPEAAALLGVSRATAYRLILARDGLRPTVNVGTGRAKTRVPASTLRDYVRRHTSA